MNLIKVDQQILDFSDRITKTLNLQKCESGMLAKQKRLFTWVHQEHIRVKVKEQQNKKNRPGKVAGFVNKLLKSDIPEEKDPIEKDLSDLSNFIKNGMIPKRFFFNSIQIPQEIQNIVSDLKGKKFRNYYGSVKGPFMNDFFILKKEDFHSIIESVQMNQLKFLMVEQKVAHLYQRNLVQQIFGRVFRPIGALSLVMKIEVNFNPLQPPYNIFCYIEDRKLQEQIEWKPIQDVLVNEDNLVIKAYDKTLQISEVNILEIFLSQILVLPLQSLVSDFIVQTDSSQAKIVKCNQQSQQQIIKQKSLKEHPSLRNPLLFFKQYIRKHSIKISDAKKITINKDLYSCFYRCLQIVIELMLTDFKTETEEIVINSSICFNQEVFSALWITFHKINLLSGWMKEVIEPVKECITISQIISHFCPIFNEISIYQADSLEAYREFFFNIEMETYLINIVKKTSLQKYKDMHVAAGLTVINKKLTSPAEIYNEIFRPILHEVNLANTDPVQTTYIFNFSCKYLYQYKPLSEDIDEKWKAYQIWQKAINVMRKEQFHFIDIGFDILGYACGIDTFLLDDKSFERIKNSEQNTKFLNAIDLFVDTIYKNWEKKSSQILSSLLQKSFKHKKFKVCRILLQKKVQITDFKQIIKSSKAQDPLNSQTKQSILQAIQVSSPRMHRLYKWQQLMIHHLKQETNESFQIETLQFGHIYLPQQFLKHIKNGKIMNNLSRKDYRFDTSKDIAYLDFGNELSFYLQYIQFPLMPYFYKMTFEQLGCSELMFNFTSFFYKNRMYQISQSLPQGLNFKKGLLTFTESDLFAMSSIELISQSIILSLIMLPTQLTLSDIILCPINQQKGEIFIIDWSSFYSKNFMSKCSGKTVLNTKNSLLLTEIMHKAVHPSIIKKYSDIDPMKICQKIFKGCKQFSEKIHSMYKSQNQQTTKQHLAMIFESGFIFNFAERMLKIKRIFSLSSSSSSKMISFFNVFEELNSQTSYLYQQIYETSISIIERQKILFNENWKRSFLHNGMIQFFGGFQKLQETQNVFPDHYYRFCFQGPTESLADMTTYIKKFKAFSQQNPDFYSTYSNQYFQYIMKNIDLSHYSKQQRGKFMEIIKNKSTQYLVNSNKKVLPLSFIKLKQAEFFKDFYLDNFSFERVQELILETCKLASYDIKSFPMTLSNILYLQLKDIQTITKIGGNTPSAPALEIKHLKILSIIDCNQLISIDLKCDILECLELRNNESLASFFIFSLNLKNIYVYSCTNVYLQNIGVYILKGINVLMCKSSCRGDGGKLHSTSYDIYINNILKQILVNFFIKQIRYLTLLTLFKMKQINENMFSKAGLTSILPFSFLFNKFNQQSQDMFITEIFKLYFTNPHLKQIVFGQFIINLSNDLPQLTISRIFNLIYKAVSELVLAKHFLSLKFENSDKIFTCLNNSSIKMFIDIFKTQKYFTLILDKLLIHPKINTNNKQIELIRKFSLQKDDIEKMTLYFKNSFISIDFLTQIFKDTVTLQEMKDKQIQMGPLFKPKSQFKMFGFSSKRSLNEQFPNHMKINRITLENCQLQDLPQTSLNKIQDPPQQKFQTQALNIKKFESLQFTINEVHSSNLHKANTLVINLKQEISFLSVKQIRIFKCNLQSFEILRFMPNVNLVSISQCHLGEENQKLKDKVSNLFNFVKSYSLKTLDLEQFFKNTQFYFKMFSQFCLGLRGNSSLKVLKLNKSSLTLQCLQNLDKIINETEIQELELDQFTLSESLRNNGLNQQPKIEIKQRTQGKRQQGNPQFLSRFLQTTTNLKSLVIELNFLPHLQAFLNSIRLNKSLLYLRLNCDNEIPSPILTPLFENFTLTHIYSNYQLPMWLLSHLQSNRTSTKKLRVVDQSIQENSLMSVYNNTFGGSSRNGYQYYRMGLSLDGGGMRGMLLATELDYLAKNVGYPLHKIFDCIGGTSIGGILALLSTGTFDGYSPVAESKELKTLFTKFGKDIFKKSHFRQIRNLIDTKYSASSFQQVLKNYFKDIKLSNCLQQTNIIVTAVNRIDNKDYIFRSKEAFLNREKDFYMRDVARATSAAPTYFPSAEIKNVNATQKLSMIDGGVGMNNPSKLVIDEIMKISANSSIADNYFLLSLGTGRLPSQTIPESAGLKDISPIIDSFSQSSNYFLERDLAYNHKGHFFRVSPLISVTDKRNGQLDNTSDEIIATYEQTGLEASKKFFNNTVIFGKYRNMNLIEWLKENTARKYQC